MGTLTPNGIGGSEIAIVMGKNSYGCARALWFEKRKVKRDFPEEDKPLFAVGNALEALACQRYTEKSGNEVKRDLVWRRNSNVPKWLAGHPDALIASSEEKGSGVLEAKTAGAHAWWEFKGSGLPERYILQLQHYLARTGCQWGAYAVLNRDDGDFRSFEVSRSEKIIAAILIAGDAFWKMVKDPKSEGPDRIEAVEAPDTRCGECCWRQTCRGAYNGPKPEVAQKASERPTVNLEENAELAKKLFQWAKFKHIRDEAAAEVDVLRKDCMFLMKEKGHWKVTCPGVDGAVTYTSFLQERVDWARVRAEHPELVAKYLSHKTSERLG